MQTLYRFKGTVETITALDSVANKNIGDVYKCKANSNDYIWNGLEWIDIGKHTDFNDVMSMIEEVQDDLAQMQTDIINDMSKKYTGRNITAPTVEGFGQVDKIYGDITETGTGDKSADNPYEIKVIGNDINLFKLTANTTTMNGITFTITADGSIVANGTATAIAWITFKELNIPANVTYTLSGCPAGGGDNSYKIYGMRTSDWGGAGNDIGNGDTFTLSQNAPVVFRVRIASGYTANNLVFKPKLQKGSVVTPFTNYGEGTVEIISKNGSNTSSNIIYKGKPLCALKNADGEIIARDRIEGNKVYRNCMYEIFDGSENWIKHSNTDNGIHTYFLGNLNLASGSNATLSKATTNSFKYSFSCWNTNKENGQFSGHADGKAMYFNSDKATLESFKTWLNSNPITIVYELLTPVVENINGSNKIVQYAESTTVYNRDNAEIEVSLTNNNTISDINKNFKHVEEKIEVTDLKSSLTSNFSINWNRSQFKKSNNMYNLNLFITSSATLANGTDIATIPIEDVPIKDEGGFLQYPAILRNAQSQVIGVGYVLIYFNGKVNLQYNISGDVRGVVFSASYIN